MTTPTDAPLAIDDLRARRAGGRFGACIEYFASIDSTNTVAERLARAGAAEGTVVIADAQTQGRGRLGRSWVSPPNRNLYLSLVLRPSLVPELAPQLALVAGVATVEAVADWVPRATLKWPNDVLIDGRKVAGLLAEMGMEGDRLAHVIVGIGVNLNLRIDELPAELRDKAGSLYAAGGVPIDRVGFIDRLLTRLQERYDLFLRQGFTALRSLWEARTEVIGRLVCIDDAQRRYEGRVVGLDDDGALLLRDAGGRESRVVAGDVTVVGGYDPS